MDLKKFKSGALQLRPLGFLPALRCKARQAGARGLCLGQAGFTLAEMLVMMVIFAIIFTLVLVNFRRGERLESFRLATEQVGTTLRQAQTQALTGIGTAARMSQAYGVYFDLAESDQYLLFQDDNGNRLYDEGEDKIIETVILPREITLRNLTTNPLTIVFEPPKPTIYINGDIILATAQVRLNRQYYPTKEGVVTLNRITGQVSAQLENVE